LHQEIHILKEKGWPSWIFLFIIFVFYTIPFTLWAIGFFNTPSIDLIIYPKNLNLFFPLILYTFIEISKTEIFFRGFLQKEAEEALGIQGGFIFQAVAYAIPHYLGGHPGGLIGGSFMLIGAYLMGYFTKKTNGLSFALICHFIVAFILQVYTF